MTSSTHNTPSVAIIGAGPGGLAAALLLAASGANVTVFERDSVIGGRTARLEANAADGRSFFFDKGPTFFLMPYVLDEIFQAAGTTSDAQLDLHRLDPMYRLLIGREGEPNISIDATQDIELMAARIAEHAPEDGKAFHRFIADNRKKLNLSEPILRKAIRNPLDLVSPKHLPILPILKPHKTVHQLLGDYFTNEHIKLAVSFQSKYLGMSPFECPSLFTILPFIEYEYGVWHPTGGCNAIMHALARVATDAGASIQTDCPVSEVTYTGRKATGVVIDGEHQQFDAVVINADAPWALKNLIPSDVKTGAAREYTDFKIDTKRYSCSTYMLYLGIEGAAEHLPHHTIYTSERYQKNLEDITTHRQLSEDPSVYIQNPSVIDPTYAPDGCSSLYCLMPTPNTQAGPGGSTIDWASDAPMLRERMLEQIETVFEIPDIRSRIVAETALTPDDWRAQNINFGATFNLAHNLGQMLHKRPQNRLKGLDRTYLVGGGTHPGSGLPTIFLSSQISAKLCCDDLGLPYAGADVPITDTIAAGGVTRDLIEA